MRATELRFGSGLALFAALALLAGCGGTSPTSAPRIQVEPEKKNDIGTPDIDKNKKDSSVTAMTSVDFAKAFRLSIAEEKARPEVFAPEFLGVIARPISADDKKLGYNPVVARAWLDRQGPADFKVEDQQKSENDDGWAYLRGSVAKGGQFGLRQFGLLCLGEKGQHRMAWFYRSTLTASGLPTKGSHPSLATATAFCDSLLGGDLEVAEALMTSKLKEPLAPPHKSDADIGYNPGLLKLKLLKEWRGDFTGYKLVKQDVTADGKTASFTGELIAAAMRQPFTMTLTKDAASGLWLVSAFKAG